MFPKIQDFINLYPALNEPPPQTRAVATTREEDGFFPVFSGWFNSRASKQSADVLIVGREWGDVDTAENQDSLPEDLNDNNFVHLRSWLGSSGLSVEQIFLTNMFQFVHCEGHTGQKAAKVYSKISPQYLSACHDVFRDTIRDLGSKVVVVCGLEAINALTSCRYFTPAFPRYCDLKFELAAQEEQPFCIGQIASLQITLFICYHWSRINEALIRRNADRLSRLWRSIGRHSQRD